MDPSHRPPALDTGGAVTEKATPLGPSPTTQSTTRQQSPTPSSMGPDYHPRTSTRSLPLPPSSLCVPHPRYPPHSSYTRPRALRIANLVRPWLPLIMYGMTSLAFVIAIAFYRPEVFSLLDDLSSWLRADEYYGYGVLFFLIFLTTIPPVPLYSTLITLSGYTFGSWTGAVISYFAALSGALAVFIVSRSFFRQVISRWLSATITIKRVVRAVEKRPKLLFLIRLAPYPYNVMNCLLAAAPTLTLRTYTICTALSLFKVIIHTSIGASVHSFKDYHLSEPDDTHEQSLTELWTALGIALCIGILIYLSIVARKAVQDELDDDPISPYDAEETMGFLASESVRDLESGLDEQAMTESSFRFSTPVTYRSPIEQVQPESPRASPSRV